jgi:acyl carrier protein
MIERVKEIMASVFEIKITEILDNASSSSIDNWDSLRHINLIVSLEEEFDVEFDEEEIIELMDLKSIIEKIESMI